MCMLWSLQFYILVCVSMHVAMHAFISQFDVYGLPNLSQGKCDCVFVCVMRLNFLQGCSSIEPPEAAGMMGTTGKNMI